MNRKIYYWKLRTAELQLGERTLIMGVLNVTPDSFSDGGHFSDPDRAYARAIEMEEQGVDIIDIGAESTKPDSKRITADEEWQRLVPVLKRLRGQLRVPLSIDTYKSEIAERALEYGIEIINDPSGLTYDPDLAKVAATGNAGLILNHMRGLPETWAKLAPMQDAIGGIGKDLEATISRARRMGVEKNRIVVDPGLGFGKRKEQNSEILAHLSRLAQLEFPVLVGPSRKSFLMQPAEDQTPYATAAAVAIAITNGAHIIRVHDVKEMRIVAHVADEIVKAGASVVKAVEDEGERPVRRVPKREATPFVDEERSRPTRPPLSKPKTPPTETFAPAAQQTTEDRPVTRRPPQDRPSKGWTPAPGERPPFEKRFSDKGPPRRDDRAAGPRGDRPPAGRGDSRPPRRDFGDRPPAGRSDSRPPRRDFGDRPPAGRTESRPPRRDFGDRPPRKDFGDKPPFRPGQGRPPRSDAPSGGSRPPRGPGQGRPPAGGPPVRRPFRKRP